MSAYKEILYPSIISSPSSMATINLHIARRHEAGSITDQEHRCSSILMRQTQLPKHVMRWPVSLPIRVLFEQRLHHCRHNIAWRDGVDSNAVLAPFCCETASELQDTGFGGVVGGTCETLDGKSAQRLRKYDFKKALPYWLLCHSLIRSE